MSLFIYITFYLIIGFAIGFAARLGAKFLFKGKGKRHRNIGRADRLGRAFLAALILFAAANLAWSPSLIIVSGFVFFEAVFSWCGLYAMMGKDTCPL